MGFEPQRLHGFPRLPRVQVGSEGSAPKYLAGLMSTHGYLRSLHSCQTPLDGGEAYPRAYLAVKLELHYIRL